MRRRDGCGGGVRDAMAVADLTVAMAAGGLTAAFAASDLAVPIAAGDFAEPLDGFVEAARLRGQLFAGGRALLRISGVALGDFLHLPDGQADLLDPARLLLAAYVH